jgi:putative aldouronate transport system permease protein
MTSVSLQGNSEHPESSKISGSGIPWNKKTKQSKTISDHIADAVVAILVVAIIAVVLYPLWFIVIASFSDPTKVAVGQVLTLPKGTNFTGYTKIFADSRIWNGYKNTLIYAFAGTALNMVVTLPAAFALSRSEFKPRRIIMFLFTFTMFFGGGLIPSYLLYKQIGILNSMWVFILPGAVSVYNLIIARSFFETSIPEELHDAAQIDGMSYIGYFVRIVLPLSSAIIAVIALYYFVGHWNDYFTRPYLHPRRQQAALAECVAIDSAGQPDQLEQCGHDGSGGATIRRTDQVRRDYRLHPPVAGHVPVPAEVFQQGCDDRRDQGLISKRTVPQDKTIRDDPAGPYGRKAIRRQYVML